MNTLQQRLRDLYVSHGISHIQEAADRIDADAERIKALEEENLRLRGIVPTVLEKLNDELCTENELLEADAERYRWLCEFETWPEAVEAAFDCGSKALIDAAIDAARSKT